MRGLGAPVLRRVIEAILVFDHGWKPANVTAALKAAQQENLVLTTLPFPGQDQDAEVYTFRKRPTLAEMDYLRDKYTLREETLTKHVLGAAFEHYVRSIIIASKCFEGVTALKTHRGKKKLGYVVDAEGMNALDLTATDAASGICYGISVKNLREWLHAQHCAIDDVIAKCRDRKLEPWLFVPFAAEEAMERCRDEGISLTILGRQIVPAELRGKHMRRIIGSLRGVIGPQPFDYNYLRFSQTLKNSPMAQRDVAQLSFRARQKRAA